MATIKLFPDDYRLAVEGGKIGTGQQGEPAGAAAD
jgi:hypothetical protein